MGRNPAMTREELLERASAHLAEVGISGATMRSVASALGISTTPLVNTFGSKEELLAAVVAWREDRDRETALSSGGDLRSIERYWLDSVSPSNINRLRLSFETVTHQSRSSEPLGETSRGWYQAWIEASRDCLLRLGLASSEAEREARSLTAMLVGLQLEVLVTGDINPAHSVLQDHLARLERRIDEAKRSPDR